ncbi:MAG: AzlC family ABC transporter permease [Clostridia bacterium]|nr:AzlC family ABC transporter permease [Clostridia bacterium]
MFLKKSKNSEALKKAFIASLPVMAGYSVLSIGFGILLNSKGFGVGWALAMSVFIYAGSMQYLAVELLAGGVSLITAALTALMVNARHLFYGVSMIERYKNAGKKKPYMIFALTDEVFSLCCGEPPAGVENKHLYYFLVSLFNQCYWVIGSVIGSLIGNIIPFSTEGIDFALTALFVTVFIDQWRNTDNHKPAITGILASAVCLLIFGADNFLIPAMLVIIIVLSLGYRRKESGQNA